MHSPELVLFGPFHCTVIKPLIPGYPEVGTLDVLKLIKRSNPPGSAA